MVQSHLTKHVMGLAEPDLFQKTYGKKHIILPSSPFLMCSSIMLSMLTLSRDLHVLVSDDALLS